MKPLLIVEACNPEWVSVPLVGWSHARAIARHTDAHIVTQVRNREALLRAGLVEGRDFTAIDSERVDRVMWKVGEKLSGGAGKGWTTVTAAMGFSYYYFERVLWKQLGARITAGDWDLVHRITPLSPTTPSLLAKKCARSGIPFIVGPLNGGVPWPKEFDAARRLEREWLSYVRSAYKLMPGYRSMRKHAAAIIVGSNDTRRLEPRWLGKKIHYIPENAIEPSRFNARRTRKPGSPIRTVFVGRLVPYKGCDMLVEAAAPLVRAGKMTVDIIGDGPERSRLESMIEKEQLSGGVRLVGWVPHTEIQHRLAECDIFGFPSIREFGGGAVLEAMAAGLVPIVVRYGGPSELVNVETGILVEIGSRDQIVAGLRHALTSLVRDPDRIEQLSAAAYSRVFTHFTWDAKAAETLQVYARVLGSRNVAESQFPAAAAR